MILLSGVSAGNPIYSDPKWDAGYDYQPGEPIEVLAAAPAGGRKPLNGVATDSRGWFRWARGYFMRTAEDDPTGCFVNIVGRHTELFTKKSHIRPVAILDRLADI